LNREQKAEKGMVEVSDVALEMCQPLRLKHWPPKTSPWLHSSRFRVEIKFGIVESNQSLSPIGINAEKIAEYSSWPDEYRVATQGFLAMVVIALRMLETWL
jgi:hypothetical protein